MISTDLKARVNEEKERLTALRGYLELDKKQAEVLALEEDAPRVDPSVLVLHADEPLQQHFQARIYHFNRKHFVSCRPVIVVQHDRPEQRPLGQFLPETAGCDCQHAGIKTLSKLKIPDRLASQRRIAGED